MFFIFINYEEINLKKLYIIGAGAFGRELESWLDSSIESVFPEYQLQGFLHSGPNDLDQYPCDHQVVGDWQDFSFGPDDAVLLGIADAKWKRRIVEKLHGTVLFPTFIHPSVSIGKHTHIGEGTIILLNSIVSCNVSIGNFVTINVGCHFGHDCTIGDFASIMTYVDSAGWTSLGEDSFIGTHATIIPHTHVGKEALIGAGSVVVRKVPEGWHVFGNPASRIILPGQK